MGNFTVTYPMGGGGGSYTFHKGIHNKILGKVKNFLNCLKISLIKGKKSPFPMVKGLKVYTIDISEIRLEIRGI